MANWIDFNTGKPRPLRQSKFTADNPPKPFDERPISHLWKPEPGDALVPQRGFITDLILATRLMETTTEYVIWSGLNLLSAVVRRMAWHGPWYPDPLWLNLFTVLVGQPGMKKTAAINVVDKIAQRFIDFEPDNPERVREYLNVFRGKITAEGLSAWLKPQAQTTTRSDGTLVEVDRGSQVSFFLNELVKLVNKAKYNNTLIGALTSFYDGLDADEVYTKGDGHEKLRNIYMTILSAATPDNFKNSFPEDASGGGFVSRLNIVYCRQSTRCFPRPSVQDGLPTLDDLAERLWWISRYARGEYHFTPQADEFYRKWYEGHWTKKRSMSEEEQNEVARKDINLLKVATLLRIQRYEVGNEISLDDLFSAKKILDVAYRNGSEATDGVRLGPEAKARKNISNIIERHTPITQRELTRKVSRYCSADELRHHLHQLVETGDVAILSDDGELTDKVKKDGLQTYVWASGEDD